MYIRKRADHSLHNLVNLLHCYVNMCFAYKTLLLLLITTAASTMQMTTSQVTSLSTYGLSLQDSIKNRNAKEEGFSEATTTHDKLMPQAYNYHDRNEEAMASIVDGHDKSMMAKRYAQEDSRSTQSTETTLTNDASQKDDVNREPIESSTEAFVDHDTIPGKSGIDFPDYFQVPLTAFQCSTYKQAGYYADPETGCQVFHVCDVDGRHDSFLCPRGTVFNQPYLTCDWWFNVDCSAATHYYGTNTDLHNTDTETDTKDTASKS